MVKISVKTGQLKNEIIRKDENYLVSIKERPEKGRANLAIIKLFKKELKKNIKIISGFKSKEKYIEFI
ncbi:MAG: DUF167 domain-containing protein [Nanoarchaeota archaeon]|nr:DUF167 domain-containing protein [Nanoarchaeota archaeon]MBU0963332.1 DUF167 domain-containing protein [Nanoarchaeota archaeon]